MVMGVLDVAPCLGQRCQTVRECHLTSTIAPTYHFLSFIAFSLLPE